jgi:hypothetical protein
MDSVMGRDGACMEKKGIEYRVLVRKPKQKETTRKTYAQKVG